MLKQFVMIATLLAANSAWACQMTSASIKGIIVGAGFENGLCVVTVSVSESQPSAVCPLRLRKNQEIVVAVRLTERQCPQDEGPVQGIVSSGGGGPMRFKGRLDGHILN